MRYSLLLMLLVACRYDEVGTNYPDRRFHFPVGLAAHPTERFVYVINTNFNLDYNSGAVSVVDLDQVIDGACDDQDLHTNGCFTEAIVNTLRMDAYGGPPVISPDGCNLFVAARAEGTVTHLDLCEPGVGAAGTCRHGDNEPVAPSDCDASHITSLTGQAIQLGFEQDDVRDPFALALANGPDDTHFLLAGHLATGAMSVAEIESPLLKFQGLVRVQTPGMSALHVLPATATGPEVVFATTRKDPGLALTDQPLSLLLSLDADDVVGVATSVSARNVNLHTLMGAVEGREMALSTDQTRLFVLQEDPDSVVVLDVHRGDDGWPVNQLLSVVLLGDSPSGAAYLARPTGDLVLVTAFEQDTVYVVDAQRFVVVARIDDVGDGPFAIATAAGGNRVVVANFNDDTLSVIDTSVSLQPFEMTVTARVGIPVSHEEDQ